MSLTTAVKVTSKEFTIKNMSVIPKFMEFVRFKGIKNSVRHNAIKNTENEYLDTSMDIRSDNLSTSGYFNINLGDEPRSVFIFIPHQTDDVSIKNETPVYSVNFSLGVGTNDNAENFMRELADFLKNNLDESFTVYFKNEASSNQNYQIIDNK